VSGRLNRQLLGLHGLRGDGQSRTNPHKKISSLAVDERR
jgi:hypothetical protein